VTDLRRAVIVGAGARGNRVFAELMATHQTGFVPAGVVEPHQGARAAFQARHDLPDDRVFASVDAFLAAPRFGDIVFICTPDPTHFSICRDVAGKGYDVVLEKPVATNMAECLALLEVEAASRTRIFVAHVLRYSPFFRTVKEVVDGGALGAIRHIHLAENIGHWHFAHSYVRGNWSRTATSAPLVLTKSSHDLDLLCWLVGRPPRSLASWGGLSYFTRENAPREAADRCTDCMLREDCLYSAVRFYLNDRRSWPFDVIAGPPDSPAAREEAVARGPYGRCVWKSDNDVCDHQTVLLDFDGGLEAVFDLQALTAENTRTIRILFDRGELNGDVRRGELSISRFTGEADGPKEERIPLPEGGDPHGGGDLQMLRGLHEHLSEGKHWGMVTSLRQSIAGHVLAFLAEESRLADNAKLPVSETLIPRSLLEAELGQP
jgi:predicted dehydrogenase